MRYGGGGRYTQKKEKDMQEEGWLVGGFGVLIFDQEGVMEG